MDDRDIIRLCTTLIVIALTGVLVAGCAWLVASIISNIPH